MYFNINVNVFIILIKVHLLVSELCMPMHVLGGSSALSRMLYRNLYVAFDLLVLKSSDMPLTYICKILSSNLALARVKIIEAFRNHTSIPSIPGVGSDKLRGLSPRANYTDRAASAGRRS